MATPAPNQQEMIARAAQSALGGEAPAPQTPETDTSKPAPNTNMGNAEALGSPETEGDKSTKDPIMYNVDRPDGTQRQLNQAQLNSMMDRYADLNYQNSQRSKVNKVVDAYIKANPGADYDTVAGKLLDLVRGGQSQPQFGADAERRQDSAAANAPTNPEALAKWAEDNAVSPPPGYSEMIQENQQMRQQMTQMMGAMQQVMQASQSNVNQALQGQQQNSQSRQEQMLTQVGQNLDRVQAHLKLPDNVANEFMIFAAERGFTEADFLDINLTAKVMTDFKHALSGPQNQRLADIQERRNAIAASGIGGSPTAGGATQEQAPETPLDRLTQATLEKRFNS